MSVSEQDRRKDYTATASQTTFAYTFKVLASTDLKVYVDDVVVTNYTVSGVGDDNGGNVVFTSGLTGGEHVVILGDMEIAQTASFSTGGPLPAVDVIAALDRGVRISQEIQERVRRAPKFAESSAEKDIAIEDPVAGQVLAYDDDGNITSLALEDLGGIPAASENILAGYTTAAFPTDTGKLAYLTDGTKAVALRRSSGIVPLDLGIYNVRHFGAKGDGATDDTAAVVAALAAVAASTAGGTAYFPAGHYLVDTDAVTIASTAAKPLTIEGEGRASYVEFVSSGGTETLALAGSSLVNLTIRNMRLGGECCRIMQLSGNGPILVEGCDISGATEPDASGAPIYGAGILVDGASDVLIRDCYFHDNGYTTGGNPLPYDIVFYSAGSRNRVEGCRIEGADTDGGIAAYNQTNFAAVRNYVDQGNKGNGTSNGYGILVYGTPTDYYECDVSHNLVRSCAGSGIYVAGSYNPTVVGNRVYDSCKNLSDASLPAAGISLNLDAGYRGEVVGNKVRTSTKAGIAFVGRAKIVGNTVMGTITTDGIQMRGTAAGSPNDYSVIMGNSIESCVQHGIGQVTGTGTEAIGVVVSGNSLDLVATNDRGISALNATRWVIQGNTIKGASGADYGIDLGADADNCVVEGNTVTGFDVGLRDLGTYNTIRNNGLAGNTATIDTSGATGVMRRGNRMSAAGAMTGVASLSGGTVTVSTAEIQTGDNVLLVRKTAAGTPSNSGHLSLGTITNGTSFVIGSTGGSDDGTVLWEIAH